MTTLTEKALTLTPHEIITSHDMTVLLAGSSPDRRYGLIKRALAAGELIHLRRGLYCPASQYRRRPLNPYGLAQYLLGPSYISLETALSYHHWIPEAVYAITNVTLTKTALYETPMGRFAYTRVPQKALLMDVERTEDSGCIYFMARPLKALADYVYVHKRDWNGMPPVVESLRVEEAQMADVTASEIEELVENYNSRRIKRFLIDLKKDLRL